MNNENQQELGVYTIPDAARILGLPRARLRRWVDGYVRILSSGERKKQFPMPGIHSRGKGRELTIGFYALIEVYVVAQLRERGVKWSVIKHDRQELKERFSTDYPFCLRGLLSDGTRILKSLSDSDYRASMELGTGGQTAFEDVLRQFCEKIDFDADTMLAEAYWPMGRDSKIVVSRHNGFGRPVVSGTNVCTETIQYLLEAGEQEGTVAALYNLELAQVRDAHRFESMALAA